MVVTVVVGFSEKRLLHAIPNTENIFLANFPKYKQTIENILQSEYIWHIAKYNFCILIWVCNSWLGLEDSETVVFGHIQFADRQCCCVARWSSIIIIFLKFHFYLKYVF